LFHKFLNLLFSLGESLGGLGEEVEFSQEFMKHFASQLLGESWARLGEWLNWASWREKRSLCLSTDHLH
jgi:hypothetical protein